MLSHSVFNPMSPQSLAISNLFIALMIVSLVIIIGIALALLIPVFRYRHRPGQLGEPPQQFGVVKLEVAWTLIPFCIVVVIFGASIAAMQLSSPPNGDPPADITVIGHQWWWEVRYPDGIITANEIHIPVGKRMFVALKSDDVIHSLWFPQLGGKEDLVPGQTNSIYLEADKPGVYEGNCVEFCGAGHAWMLAQVIAQPPAQYAAWQRQQLAPPSAPSSGLAAQGASLFGQLSCISCHVLTSIGPNLTHFASRRTLAGGRLDNTPANVRAWLHDPAQIKPGVHMPNLHLTPSELNELTAYLESLK
jgi:cytochrome c oxidase subunit 2